MYYLLCPDKFRGSLTAEEVCQSLAKGIRTTNQNANIVSCPLADGGEGSLEIVKNILGLKIKTMPATDPIGRHIMVPVGVSKKACYIESAKIIGLNLLSLSEKNPMKTSTAGMGQLIFSLINEGYGEFHLFLGGSATHDGGAGMAAAMGYKFWGPENIPVIPVGANLIKVKGVVPPGQDFKNINFKVYSDVRHVMFGPVGAAYGFAAQKGAGNDELEILDKGMQNFTNILSNDLNKNVADIPGSGAAGGLAGGCIVFLNAELRSGVDFFVKITNLEEKIENADVVITGEGKLDESSFTGKVTGKIVEICKNRNKKLIIITGQNALMPIKSTFDNSLDVISILQYAGKMEVSLNNASEYLFSIGQEIAQRFE